MAAKITHVPSMYLSELPGDRHGTRLAAIDGHLEIACRCRALGVDTLLVFDTHWPLNAGHHVNCARHFKGVYPINELPHFIANLPFEAPDNPALGRLLAEGCNRLGVPCPNLMTCWQLRGNALMVQQGGCQRHCEATCSGMDWFWLEVPDVYP